MKRAISTTRESAQQDGTWIAYDKTLGPSLRLEPSPSVEYYGFNTTRAPFTDVHVRRAFEMGIDWRRIVTLESNPLQTSATGMVPAGIPGHSTTDFGPVFDLAKAKSELAAAGYPNGVGFPKVVLVTVGLSTDSAIIQQLHDNLGIDITEQAADWATYSDMLNTDPPAMWWMDWVADYPGANDFLGLLLGSGPAQQLLALVQQRLRRGHGQRPGGHGPGVYAAGAGQGAGDRARPGAGDTGRLRSRLRAGGSGASRCDPEQRGFVEIRRSGVGGRHMSGLIGRPLLRRLAAAAISVCLGFVYTAGPVAAQSISFGTGSASSHFGVSIVFDQPYSGSAVKSATVLIQQPGDPGPTIFPLDTVGSGDLSYTLDTSSGGPYPFTPIVAHFEVVLNDGTVADGPEIDITYADDTHTWHTLVGKVVRLHWVGGSNAWGQQMLGWAEAGIAKAAAFFGVTETAPIDYYVYPDQASFGQALNESGTDRRRDAGGLPDVLRRCFRRRYDLWQQRNPA